MVLPLKLEKDPAPHVIQELSDDLEPGAHALHVVVRPPVEYCSGAMQSVQTFDGVLYWPWLHEAVGVGRLMVSIIIIVTVNMIHSSTQALHFYTCLQQLAQGALLSNPALHFHSHPLAPPMAFDGSGGHVAQAEFANAVPSWRYSPLLHMRGEVIGLHKPVPLVALYFPASHPLHLSLTSSYPGLHQHDGVVVLPLAKHVLLWYTQA